VSGGVGEREKKSGGEIDDLKSCLDVVFAVEK
jgi:hypothetical protein